jgi:phosphate transport system substrate-binding protein
VKVNGRTFDTGSQVFLQEAVMLGSPLREDIVSHKSNIGIVEAVAKDKGAIGFGGLSYATSDVKAVPLALFEGQDFVAIDSPEADQGLYPLVRPVQREFIKYIFSQLGQEDVIKAGFQAIPARPARVALDAVGLGLSR